MGDRSQHERYSPPLWDDTKTFVFRDITKPNRLTTNPSFEVVDIQRSDSNIDTTLSLFWDDVQDKSYHHSSCQIITGPRDIQTVRSELCDNNYHNLRQICLKLFRRFEAKVVRVCLSPLTLVMVHRSVEACRTLQVEEQYLRTALAGVMAGLRDTNMKVVWEDNGAQESQRTEVSTTSRTEAFQEYSQTLEDPSLSFVVLSHEETEEGSLSTVRQPHSSSSDVYTSTPGQASTTNNPDIAGQAPQDHGTESTDEDKGYEITEEELWSIVPNSNSSHPYTSVPDSSSVRSTQTHNTGARVQASTTEPPSIGTTPEMMDQIHQYLETEGIEALELSEIDEFAQSSDGSGDQQEEEFADIFQTSPKILQPEETYTKMKLSMSETSLTGNTVAQAEEMLTSLGLTRRYSEFERIRDTVALAMVDDVVMPPKGKCLDTILCLDASSSLGEEGFQQMKTVAMQFVNGIEKIAEEDEIEENISVVAYGGRSRIEHFLSHDYSSVKDAIDRIEMGGRSPLLEALFVCLAAFHRRGGTLNISGVHKLKHRLIVVTDGKPSDDKDLTGLDVELVDDKVTMRLLKVMEKVKRKKIKLLPYPVIWIPVGNANETLINSFAKMSGGMVCRRDEIRTVCRYQRVQESIGKTFAYISKGMSQSDLTDDIKVLIDALSGDLDEAEKQEVLETVKAKLEGRHGYDCEEEDPLGFDNVLQLEDPQLPPLGSRVVRGPNWKWGNQDTDGPGTVINHLRKPEEWISVLWDNGKANSYRFGAESCYDVAVVTDQPKWLQSDMLIQIGCEVTRGNDWQEKQQDQDGGEGGVGVVIRTNDRGEVKVRWKLTHVICIHRYGRDDKLDVAVRDPADILKELTTTVQTTCSRDKRTESTDAPLEEGRYVWEWRDVGGSWNPYPADDIRKIEAAYCSPKTGSCLVRRCGVSCRIIFKDMIERSIDAGTRVPVRRRNDS